MRFGISYHPRLQARQRSSAGKPILGMLWLEKVFTRQAAGRLPCKGAGASMTSVKNRGKGKQ